MRNAPYVCENQLHFSFIIPDYFLNTTTYIAFYQKISFILWLQPGYSPPKSFNAFLHIMLQDPDQAYNSSVSGHPVIGSGKSLLKGDYDLDYGNDG